MFLNEITWPAYQDHGVGKKSTYCDIPYQVVFGLFHNMFVK